MDNLNDHDPITVIEFCAGYGGLGLGIKGVLGERMRLIGLCELEGFAQANLISKMEAGLMAQVPIWSNLLTFPYRKFRGLVDIAAAGIPCQPHSLAGKRSGGGDERFLFDDWLCGLEQMQPRAIFIENVEGFLSSKMPDGTLCVEWTIKRLEAMGYKSATGIFSAREVGAPHQRKRVFILAHRKCTGLEGLHQWDASSEQIESRGSDAGPGSQRCVWPSRPGQPQHGFEPPRVVIGRMANSNGSQSSEGRGDDGEMPEVPAGEWADDSSIVSGGESQHRGEDEAMGDSSTEGLQRPRISGEMDSKSRGAEGKGSELAPASSITGNAHGGEGSELADSKLHGHTSAEIAGGIGSEQGEGGMLQPSGVGTSRRDIPDATSGSNMANARSVCGERPDPDRVCGREICESPRRDEVRSEDCGCGEGDGGERASVGNSEGGMPRQSSARDWREGAGGASEGRQLGDTEEQGCGRLDDESGEIGGRETRGHADWSSNPEQQEQWQAESTMGRNAYGTPNWMDYAELSISCDNRTDELRLLGNGVVPATATIAFRTLLAELLNE